MLVERGWRSRAPPIYVLAARRGFGEPIGIATRARDRTTRFTISPPILLLPLWNPFIAWAMCVMGLVPAMIVTFRKL